MCQASLPKRVGEKLCPAGHPALRYGKEVKGAFCGKVLGVEEFGCHMSHRVTCPIGSHGPIGYSSKVRGDKWKDGSRTSGDHTAGNKRDQSGD